MVSTVGLKAAQLLRASGLFIPLALRNAHPGKKHLFRNCEQCECTILIGALGR